jgi:hypothetical protein
MKDQLTSFLLGITPPKQIAVAQFEYSHRWLASGYLLRSVFDFV